MKSKLIGLFLLLSAAGSLSAQCDSCQYRSCGFYLSGMFGLNFEIFDVAPDDLKMYPGFAASGSLGYKFQNNLRLDFEYSYRRNGIRSGNNSLGENVGASGHTDTQAYLVNFLYDIDLFQGWTPYIGVGVGYARLESCVNAAGDKRTGHSQGAATQYIGGLAHRIMYNTDLGVEYRYFRSRQYAQDHTVAMSLRRFF